MTKQIYVEKLVVFHVNEFDGGLSRDEAEHVACTLVPTPYRLH
jgi:hypothetical protein